MNRFSSPSALASLPRFITYPKRSYDRRPYFLMIMFCIYRDFLLFAGVNLQISAVSSVFSATDHKHVLLICFDIFSSMFLILNNI